MILSAKNFKTNLQNRKQKFFRSLNAIFGKIGTFSSPSVVISLVESYCVPILLYGLDCIELPKSMLQSLENAYSQLYSKLFHTYNKNIIKQCQFYSRQMPIELKVANRRYNFLKKINTFDSSFCKYFDVKNDELLTLINKYCCNDYNANIMLDNFRLENINWSAILRCYFERSLEQLI